MIRSRLLALVAVVSLGGITLSAIAAPSLPDGWYLEGNVGGSRSSNVSYGNGTTFSGGGFGWNVNGGYKFLPYFGTEVGVTSYGQNSVKSSGIKLANVSHYSYDIAGKAILPVSDSGFEFFAKLGLARAHSNVSTTSNNVSGVTVTNTGTNNSTGAYYGLGADYSFVPNLAGIVQWARAKGNNSIGNLDLFSIGLSYTFD